MQDQNISVETFKKLKPNFTDVPDETVSSYIDMSTIFVNTKWPPKNFMYAQAAMVCHLMTIDGLGNGSDAKAFASGHVNYRRIKSGTLSIEQFEKEVSGTGFENWVNQTDCGKFFMSVARRLSRGPLIASSVVDANLSPYAKDLPWRL